MNVSPLAGKPADASMLVNVPRGLRMQPPDGGRHLAPRRPTRGTRIATIPILGGLHHRHGFGSEVLAPTSNEAVA